MKNKISLVVILLTMILIPRIARAYDYSAISPSGQRLYYNFVNGSARVVNMVGNENSYVGGGYLSGDLIIPDTIYYNGYPIAVGSIGAYAFTACNITSVTIPKTVTLVRQFVFYQCNSLKTVNYTGTLSQWCSIIFEHDQSNPLAHAKKLYINGEHVVDVNITSGISEIKPYVFYCSDIHSVSIPNTVTTIGENAFADCFKLQPVTIPSSVNNIGYRAFGNVPMVFYYGTMSGAPWGARFLNGYVEDSLYFSSSAKNTIVGCIPDKKNVVIPNTVTTIYNMAFYCYDEIKSVTIPSSVTTIQPMAFNNCESLIPVTIPSSVTSIGSNAFYNVHMVYYQGTASGRPWGALAMNGYEENGLYYTSSAKDSLVYVSPSLTSVTIPSSVIYIGDNAVPINNNIDTLHLNTFMFNGFASNKYNMDSVSVLYIGASPFWPSAFTSSNPNIITINVEAPRTSIPNNAFRGSINLSTVTLPSTMTIIGNCSFENCMGLSSIIIPESVTSIGDGVFRNCRNLISVFIPNSITSIGYEAFRGCQSLTSFTIPCSVTTLGYNVFYGAKIDTLYYNADSIDVTYNNRPCFDSVMVVFIGNNVRTWNEYLFKGCVGINSAHIGDSITAIPANAFNGCVNLSSVIIPNSVTQIGGGAFANCSSLVSMTIPNSVTSMGASVFENCSNLSSVIIGNSVTAIEYQSFYNCSSLSSVTIGSSVASMGYYAFRNCRNLSSVTIPNSVNVIENSVFRDCISLSSVTIPNSVTSLGSYVFYNCSSLSSVVIGDSVSTIQHYSFYGDSNLSVLRLGRLVNVIESNAFTGTPIDTLYFDVDSMGDLQNYNLKGWDSIHVVVFGDHVRSIPAYAFYNCKNLSSVTIPSSVNSIREAAFQNCRNLASVTIGESVTNIGQYAFYGDGNMAVLRLGRSINTIGNGAFTGTRIDTLYYDIDNISLLSNHHLWDSVRVVYLGDNVRVWPTNLLRGLQRLNTVVVGDSISSIPNDAMYGCNGLTSITIGNSVSSIGSYAFYGCGSLGYVEMPNSVTSIGLSAFGNCTSLTSVSLPNSITSIGYSTFDGCSSLSAVTIPNSVTSIGSDAFNDCTSLTSVTLPNSVTTLGSYAFSGCTNLVSVSLPEHITSISSGLFSGCSSLASIHIPDSVTNIGTSAFNGCASLTSISLGKNLRSLNNNTYNCYNSCFGGCVSLDTLYYDCDSLGKYNLTNNYGFDSVSVVYVGPNVRYWPSVLFSGRHKLREATINVSKTPIADGAFSSCHNLSKVTILDSVKVIGYSAFSNCDSLKFVYISDSVDSIATGAFSYCTNLEEIVLPQSITRIERELFAECASLRSIVIPDSVASIGYYAFYNCENLTTVSLGKKLQSIECQFWPSFEGCVSIDTLYINCDSISCFPLWSSRIGFDSISVAYVGNNVRYWPINLFRNYRRLRSVIIDTGVSYIGSRAFEGCTSLESVVIPNSVTTIGAWVFNNCTGLISMIIPNSVTSLGSGAFDNCTSLVSVTLPDSLTTIEYSTFNNCNSITSVTIPNSVTVIENLAFNGCSSLESINIPNQITTIATATFNGCSSLGSITIPSSVTTIESYAFGNCSSLDSVNMPNSVHTIGNYAFYNCSNLADLEIGGSVLTIGDNAFDYCNNLDSVTIPNSVTYIGNNAFQHCGNMSSLTLGNSLSTIGDSAFYNCTGLVSVTALSEYPPLVLNNSHELFPANVLNNVVLTVPCSAVYHYYINPTWGLFDTISGFGDGYVEWMCYDTACGSYTWINGQTYTYNTYGATFYQEAVGVCDTMYNLLLTIHPTYSRTVLLEACDNMLPYNYADTLLQGAGLYNIMFESQYGCDSLIRLDFRIKPSYETYENMVLCQSMLPYYSPEYDTYFNDGVGRWTYEYMRQSIHGCDSLITLQVVVHPSENTEICMVTVENGHNNVIWNRGADVSGYNIYREGLTANQYDLVATILTDTMMSSMWIDTDSDPVARSYRYRIASVDRCDIESDWSPVHKTMHLTINQGIGNTWNLVWSEYEGAVYSTYQIYRGTSASDVELIDEMPSNNTSYTDQNVEQSTIYYQVAIVKDEPCYNTKSTNIIRSNFATSNYEGIQVAGNIIVSVYPNPTSNSITISSDSHIKRVDLLDMAGRCLKTLGATESTVNISLDDCSSGIYMLRVTTNKGTAVHKITVE